MHIAICDDEQKDLDALASLIREYDTSGTMQIFRFSSAQALYQFARKETVDIAVLDIEMESPNGYEIARQLMSQEKQPIIIFVTNSMAYTMRGYGVAHRYLSKPLSKPLLWEALDSAVLKVKANRFTFTIDGGNQVVRIDDIYYFEVFNHVAVLHTCNREYTFRASLKDISMQLPMGYFGSPHQSYLINYTYVKSAHATEIILTNGAHIPVSRRKLKAFQEDFHVFLGRL